jgi:hypothetical protein
VHRDAQLRDALPATDRVRLVQSTTASAREHDAIVALGFEGTILKRPASTYRPGRQTTWRKYKARHRATAVLRSLRPGRDGKTYAVCEPDGRRILALAGASLQPAVGKPAELVYSRAGCGRHASRGSRRPACTTARTSSPPAPRPGCSP